MPPALTFSVLELLLLLQGSGCLLLALVAGALCLPRCRQPACCWAAAWACQGGAFLLIGSPIAAVAPVLAVWSAYFWALGAWLYLSQPVQSELAGEVQPHLRLLHLMLGCALLGGLGGGIAWLMPAGTSLAACLVLIALGQGLTALILMRRTRGDSDLGARATVVALLLSAGLGLFEALVSDRFPLPAVIGLAGWGVLAVASLFFLINEEQARLREAYRKQEEHEERFRLIFEHSGVGMALMRPDGRVIQVNPSLTAMLGYEAEELKDRRLSDLIASEDRTSEIQLARTQDTPSLYEREKRYLHKNGEIVWAKVLRVPIRDASGQPRYYVGVLVNITARRKAEEALSDSEKRYRLLHQVANDGIYVTGETGEILDVNPAFARMLGLSRNDLIGKPVTEFAADPEALRRHLREVLDRGNSRLETQLRRRDGQLVEAEVSAALLELEGRRLVHGICRDMTERKQADRELRQTQQRLREERDFTRQILETADVLIFVVDVTGRIVRFNGACVQASGYREEEVLGRVFWEALFPERSRELVRDGFERAVVSTPSPARTPLPVPLRRGAESRRGAVLADEISWRISSGQERLVAWRHSVVRDAQGASKYVIYTGIDITEQRRLEEEVRQARKLETLGTLVGGIAHDFNNHLTVILGNLSLALSDLAALERTGVTIPPSALRDLHGQLDQVDAAAQRCADVTRRLLTFGKGRTPPLQPTALPPLLEETVNTIRGQAPELEVQLECEPGLWTVLGDASQLQQVLSILASNARDAMPAGGTLTLRASNRLLSEEDQLPHHEARPGHYVELIVRDTGKGMPPEVRERLFEPFFTTKEIGKGTGMGLAMVYGIVKAHKGWICVDSVPERGSAFTLYLPAAPSLTPADNASVSVPASACVLVVDDEDQVRNLARLILERAGYRVLDAANGEEAAELYAQRASEIDLVLMDYAMPRMNGLEAFQRMRQITPNLRVIFSSGYTMDVDGEQLIRAGARAFVPKPYRPDALVRLVREVLASPEPQTPRL